MGDTMASLKLAQYLDDTAQEICYSCRQYVPIDDAHKCFGCEWYCDDCYQELKEKRGGGDEE